MTLSGIRHLFLVLFVVAASVFPSRVALAETPAQSAPQGSLTIAISTDPVNLNVWGTPDAYREVNDNIFQRLYSFDSDGAMVPVLAASLPTTTDSGLTWTVKLRPDVVWNDGTKFTSADVKFNYELIASTRVNAIDKPLLANLISVETPDTSTAVFKFKALTLPWIFGSPTSSLIQPVGIMGNTPAGGFQNFSATLPSGKWPGNAVGTGPYVPVEYVAGDHIILQANPKYWGTKPQTDKLIFRIIPTANTALLALRQGEVNVVSPNGYSFAIQDLKNLKTDSKLKVVSVPSYNKYWIAFSQFPETIAANPWLGNVKAREALMHAIDRNAILTGILGGLYPATWGVFASNSWANNKSLAIPSYDVALAKKMLDDAGYPVKSDGSRFSFKLFYQNAGYFGVLAQALKEMYAQVNVNVELAAVEQAAGIQILTTRGIRDYPMALSQNSGGPDPDSQVRYIRAAFIPPAAGSNLAGYNNPAVDQLLNQGASSTDQSARQQAYTQVENLVAGCYCFYSLTLLSNNAIMKNDVAGWESGKVVFAYSSFGQLYTAKAPVQASPAAASPGAGTPAQTPAASDLNPVVIALVVLAVLAVGLIALRRTSSS